MPMTVLLILACVGVAVIELVMGVSLDSPTGTDLVRFGANFLPLTLGDEPWRLVSSAFLHIGVLHLMVNGFALYFFGQVVELTLGRFSLLALFVLSAIGGNLLNLYSAWQGVLTGEMVGLSAGASGGIMGLGSALLVLAVMRTPTPFMLNAKSLALVMALNLMMGFAIDGIDNAGHIGGALTGVVLGLVYAVMVRGRHRKVGLSAFWVAALGLVAVFWVVWRHLHMELLAYV